jgi:hypothetical protein
MRSFLQAVSKVTEEAPTPLRVVQMEGLVIALEPPPFVTVYSFDSVGAEICETRACSGTSGRICLSAI